jgi:hypothetical protein
MSRQRMIHPSLWSDPGFLEMSLPARHLFIGLFSLADDEGRGASSIRSLKHLVFPNEPYTPEELEGFKAEIMVNVRCVFYMVDGKEY